MTSAERIADVIDLDEFKTIRIEELEAERDLRTIENLIAMWRKRELTATRVMRIVRGSP